MKRIVIGSLLATSLFCDMGIVFSKNFEKKIKPNILTTQLIFNIQKQPQNVVTDKLAKISEIITGEKSVDAKGGDYNINPNMVYTNSKN